MKGFHVPELRRKLDLLIETGHFADRVALHSVLKRDDSTVRGWINGNSGQPPGTVPQKSLNNVLRTFAIAMPHYSESRIRDLLAGPLNDLEQTLKPASENSLRALIAREADTASVTLIVDEGGTLSIARRARRFQPAPHHRIGLGQWFRMEITTRSRATYVIALQSAPGGWIVLPSSLNRNGLVIHVPGPDEEGETGFLVEDNEIGWHQFIIAQVPQRPAGVRQSRQLALQLPVRRLRGCLRCPDVLAGHQIPGAVYGKHRLLVRGVDLGKPHGGLRTASQIVSAAAASFGGTTRHRIVFQATARPRVT